MALVFHRRLAIPLWAIGFLTVALTVPPPSPLFVMPSTTLFTIAVFGMAMMIFTTPGVVSWLRVSRSVVRVLPPRQWDQRSEAFTMAAGTYVGTLGEPNRSTAADALELVRMDDEGSWHMARPPA
jgi:hypothetical protein